MTHNIGHKTPYEKMKHNQKYETASISSGLTRDVLLMAGTEDHYVPVHQLPDQIATLAHVCPPTVRLFTRAPPPQAVSAPSCRGKAASSLPPPWLWYRRSQKPQGGCINRCIPGIYLELYLNFGPPAPQHPFLRRPAKSRLRPLTASLHRRIILPSLTAAKLLPQSVAELDLFLTDIQMRRKEIL